MLRLTTLALTSSLALMAQAILIPSPDMTNALDVLTHGIKDAGNALVPAGGMSIKTVELECKGCPLAKKEGDKTEWVDGVQNSLVLRFLVDDENKLSINDVPVFPTEFVRPQPIFAAQVQTGDNGDKSKVSTVRLNYRVVIADFKKISSNEETITVTFKALSLDGKDIPKEVDSVVATMTKDGESGKLTMIKAESKPSSGDDDDSCPEGMPALICRLRAMFRHRFHRMKAGLHRCAHKMRKFGHHMSLFGHHHGHRFGKKCGHHHQQHHMQHMQHMQQQHHGHHLESVSKGNDVDSHPIKSIYQYHRDQQGNGHNNHRGGFFRVAKRVALQIFVPIMIGIAAGMTASVLGMIIGQIIVLIWRRFRKSSNVGRARGYIHIGNTEEEGEEEVGDVKNVHVIVSEKESFLDEDEEESVNRRD